MARFNEILVGRYNRYLQKLLGFKGGPPSAQLSSEIMPVIHNDSGAENRYLQGWDRFAMAQSLIAVAGFSSVIRLRNPLTSNIVAVFERLIFFNFNVGSTPILRSGPTNTDLPSVFVFGNKRLDPRGRPDSGLITSQQTVGGGTLLQARLQGNTGPLTFFDFITTDIGEIPLLPGDALEIDGATTNSSCGMSFLWRERLLEDSERA